MKKFIFFLFLVLTWFIIPSSFPQETVTISTYYPSPVGVYLEVRSQRAAIGETYYDGAQHPWNTTGTQLPNEINQDADLVVEGNVGIGTTATSGFQRNGSLYHVRGLEISGNEPEGVGIRMMNTNTGSDAGTAIWWFGNNNNDAILSMGLDRNQTGQQPFLWTVDNDLRIGTSDTTSGDDSVKIQMKVNGNVGIGTTNPQAILDVAGEIKLGVSTPALSCGGATAGAMKYDSGTIEYCDGNSWKPIGKNKTYDTGWFACNAGGENHDFAHNLGTTALILQCLFAKNNPTTHPNTNIAANYPEEEVHSGNESFDEGVIVQEITDTTFRVRTGEEGAGYFMNSAGDIEQIANGYCRVIALAAN